MDGLFQDYICKSLDSIAVSIIQPVFVFDQIVTLIHCSGRRDELLD